MFLVYFVKLYKQFSLQFFTKIKCPQVFETSFISYIFRKSFAMKQNSEKPEVWRYASAIFSKRKKF